MSVLKKTACLTDIHFGRRSNSEQHNQDCLNYIKWFCNIVKNDKTITSIFFLGDWHENRNALNVSTLVFSYAGAKLLNEVGLPVFFVLGNHDLYHRYNRNIYSTAHFEEFSNFTIITQPTIVDQFGEDILLCPFLFENELSSLSKFRKIKNWFGHFEFKGFVVTGYNIKLDIGPSHKNFREQDHIISGHFHRRQNQDNVYYMGNTFPMDFSDAGDNERGCAIFDHSKNSLSYIDWPDCPRYIKTTLSRILDGKIDIPPNTILRCITDIPLTFEDSSAVHQELMEKYSLRELRLEETDEIDQALKDTQVSLDTEDLQGVSINDLVIQMLSEIDTNHIDNDLLIEIYHSLKT